MCGDHAWIVLRELDKALPFSPAPFTVLQKNKSPATQKAYSLYTTIIKTHQWNCCQDMSCCNISYYCVLWIFLSSSLEKWFLSAHSVKKKSFTLAKVPDQQFKNHPLQIISLHSKSPSSHNTDYAWSLNLCSLFGAIWSARVSVFIHSVQELSRHIYLVCFFATEEK